MEIFTEAPTLTSVNNGSESMNDKQLGQIRNFLIKEGLPDVYASDYSVVSEIE